MRVPTSTYYETHYNKWVRTFVFAPTYCEDIKATVMFEWVYEKSNCGGDVYRKYKPEGNEDENLIL